MFHVRRLGDPWFPHKHQHLGVFMIDIFDKYGDRHSLGQETPQMLCGGAVFFA